MYLEFDDRMIVHDLWQQEEELLVAHAKEGVVDLHELEDRVDGYRETLALAVLEHLQRCFLG